MPPVLLYTKSHVREGGKGSIHRSIEELVRGWKSHIDRMIVQAGVCSALKWREI